MSESDIMLIPTEGKLSPSVSELNNISHVASKAECLSVNNGHVLNNVAMQLVGDTWKQQFRFCDN